jgi:methylated-DNA-[protein]-cysteine S-methyltransferase
MIIRFIDTPVGKLTLAAGPAGLRAVLWPGAEPGRVAGNLGEGDVAQAEAHLDAAAVQLDEYFAGDREAFDLALDPVGTEFQLRAWAELRQIPYGATISYGEQARRMGDSKAGRAVGAANGRNPLSVVVPCHRVVGAGGKLTGFGGGLTAKAWLLDHERSVVSGG